MKKKLLLLSMFLIALGGGIGLGVYIRNQTLNPRATIPNVFERTLSFFVRQGEKEDDDLLYYDIGLPILLIMEVRKQRWRWKEL